MPNLYILYGPIKVLMVDIALLFALGALICGATGLIIAALVYRRPPPWLKGMTAGLFEEGMIGKEIRAAYPPEDVAGIAVAIVESQKPAMMHFYEHDLIPGLARIGGAEVASELGKKSATLRAADSLGGGLNGLQGLVGLLGAPSKKSGVGDLMQYLPLLQQLTKGSQSQGNGPPPQSANVVDGNYHVGGKLGGN